MPDGRVQAFPELARVRPLRRGDREAGLIKVQQFLQRFGFLNKETFHPAGVLDAETSHALARFQQFHAVPPTGEFDELTRDAMTTARCGLPDLDNGIAFVTSCSWRRRGFTYAFDTGTADMPNTAPLPPGLGAGGFQLVRNAFRTWAAAAPLTFAEVSLDKDPDIRIGWRHAADPDFNMVGGTLAHADFPPGCGFISNTRPRPVHFDDEEHTWVSGAVSAGFDVESIALHEIGHILGLRHTTVNGAVMFPSISENFTLRVLQADDLANVTRLYPRPPVVVAWGQSRLDVFSLGQDNAMYHRAWDGTQWVPGGGSWEPLGGIFTGPPAVVAWGPGRLDIFARGTDRAMYHKAWDGTQWVPGEGDWESLGVSLPTTPLSFASPPAAIAWGPGRLDIFGLGQDRAMYHRAWDGTQWLPSGGDWENLGGDFNSPPGVAARAADRLDVLALGINGAMQHKAWDGTQWLPGAGEWEDLGGMFTSPPSVVARGANRLDIFGLGQDRAMYHRGWDGKNWVPSGWEDLGGDFTSPPSVAVRDSNRLDLFAVGTDGAMYHNVWNGTQSTASGDAWESLGGVFTSPPSVAARDSNRLDVFGLGTDRAMYHRAWDGLNWVPPDWERLGGLFA